MKERKTSTAKSDFNDLGVIFNLPDGSISTNDITIR